MSEPFDKTFTTKLWALRLGSIPVLLFFPCVCILGVVILADRYWGISYPLFQVFWALVFSGLAYLCLLPWTVFAPRQSPLRKGTRILMFILGFELLALLLLWLTSFPEKPYTRASLEFQNLAPPIIDVTGTWEGTWTDPRKKMTEHITLTLDQDDDIVTGTIVDASGKRWRIVEGNVSNDQVNLLYTPELAFRSRGATLVGTLKDGRLTGEYYGHDQAKAGWSSHGTWQAKPLAK